MAGHGDSAPGLSFTCVIDTREDAEWNHIRPDDGVTVGILEVESHSEEGTTRAAQALYSVVSRDYSCFFLTERATHATRLQEKLGLWRRPAWAGFSGDRTERQIRSAEDTLRLRGVLRIQTREEFLEALGRATLYDGLLIFGSGEPTVSAVCDAYEGWSITDAGLQLLAQQCANRRDLLVWRADHHGQYIHVLGESAAILRISGAFLNAVSTK